MSSLHKKIIAITIVYITIVIFASFVDLDSRHTYVDSLLSASLVVGAMFAGFGAVLGCAFLIKWAFENK